MNYIPLLDYIMCFLIQVTILFAYPAYLLIKREHVTISWFMIILNFCQAIFAYDIFYAFGSFDTVLWHSTYSYLLWYGFYNPLFVWLNTAFYILSAYALINCISKLAVHRKAYSETLISPPLVSPFASYIVSIFVMSIITLAICFIAPDSKLTQHIYSAYIPTTSLIVLLTGSIEHAIQWATFVSILIQNTVLFYLFYSTPGMTEAKCTKGYAVVLTASKQV